MRGRPEPEQEQPSITERDLLYMLRSLHPPIVITQLKERKKGEFYYWTWLESHGDAPDILTAVKDALETIMVEILAAQPELLPEREGDGAVIVGTMIPRSTPPEHLKIGLQLVEPEQEQEEQEN